jgi:hypothetical protein
LGQHDSNGLCSVTNVMNWDSLLSQEANNPTGHYVIEELEGHQAENEDGGIRSSFQKMM